MSESPNRTTGSDPGDLPAHPEVIRIATQLGLGPDDLETLMDVARDADAIVRLHKEREERRREATPQHPTRLIFRNQDPWPEPVATAELLRTLTAAISAHVALPQGGSQIVALWAMHTHALGAFSVTPRLVIRSRQPRSGKTTLLSLLAQLTPRPLKVCALSPRAVSWSLRYRPTLLLDDGNTLIDAIGEVRAILRNGHSRLAGHLLNARPGFSSDLDVFAAAAIAVEGDAPQILSGRSIEIELERPLSGEGITRLDQGAMDRLSQLHQMAARWAQDRMESLSAAQAAAPYRADDYWTPLLLITADAGPQWQRQAHTAMQIIRDASASNLERLLADIRALIGERRSGRRQITDAKGNPITDQDRIRSADLVGLLATIEDQPWGEWGKAGTPITPYALSLLLAKAGVHPSLLVFHIIDDNGVRSAFRERGYRIAQLEKAIARNLPDDAQAA